MSKLTYCFLTAARGPCPRLDRKDLAASIGARLAKDALAIQVNGALTDLSSPLEDGVKVAVVTPASPYGREVLRHSTAHVLARR